MTKQKILPITVCMISGEEASRIGRALESVSGWTSEIVVVLNQEAGDGTEEIAHQHGAKVWREPWKGFVAQKNSANQKATQEWLLGLDADEAVSSGLRKEISHALLNPRLSEQCAAFSFPRLTCFCGRWIRHGDWYPDRTVRLWRRGKAEWGGVDPHAKLTVRGEIGKLHGDLWHYNAESIDRQLAKIVSYSDDFVRHTMDTNRGSSRWDMTFRPAFRFFRTYFLRLGFLDGWQGCYIAWMTAFHTATRYAKVREALRLAQHKAGQSGDKDHSANHVEQCENPLPGCHRQGDGKPMR